MKTATVQLSETLTISLKAGNEPNAIEYAFDKLHRRVKEKKGRKFFGVIRPDGERMDYRACVATNDELEFFGTGFEKYTIPGGKYMSTTLRNWDANLRLIPALFEEMGYNQIIDKKRPQLEFYKSMKELVLMLPIIPREEQLKLF